MSGTQRVYMLAPELQQVMRQQLILHHDQRGVVGRRHASRMSVAASARRRDGGHGDVRGVAGAAARHENWRLEAKNEQRDACEHRAARNVNRLPCHVARATWQLARGGGNGKEEVVTDGEIFPMLGQAPHTREAGGRGCEQLAELIGFLSMHNPGHNRISRIASARARRVLYFETERASLLFFVAAA